ncbi:MAG: response regulator [Proteobacteria bacterium]|nr:response regulator [Pseudomonadota bacterium]
MTTPMSAMAVEHASVTPVSTVRPLIVVIEDDYRSSMALTMLIDDWGYSCVAARSSREVVKTLGHRLSKVSAIITDVEIDGQMRGIRDALAIAATIGHSVPTIITTGHSDFAAASPFPVIRKPFDPDILHQWLMHKLGSTLS